MNTIEILSEFPPLPDPPSGHHWVPRGWGYVSECPEMYCVISGARTHWAKMLGYYAGGFANSFYVTASPNPDQREEVVKLQEENRELLEALFNLTSYCESSCDGEPGWPRDAVEKANHLLAQYEFGKEGA